MWSSGWLGFCLSRDSISKLVNSELNVQNFYSISVEVRTTTLVVAHFNHKMWQDLCLCCSVLFVICLIMVWFPPPFGFCMMRGECGIIWGCVVCSKWIRCAWSTFQSRERENPTLGIQPREEGKASITIKLLANAFDTSKQATLFLPQRAKLMTALLWIKCDFSDLEKTDWNHWRPSVHFSWQTY